MRYQDRAREIGMFLAVAIIGATAALGEDEIRTEIHSMGGVTTQDFDAGAAITLTVDGDTDLVNIYDKDTGTLDNIGGWHGHVFVAMREWGGVEGIAAQSSGHGTRRGHAARRTGLAASSSSTRSLGRCGR